MRIGRPAVVAALVASTWVLLPGGPAAGGAYCRTLQDRVPVYAEPRQGSGVVHVISRKGHYFECTSTSAAAWWRATAENDAWTGYVEKRLVDSSAG